MRAMVAQCHRRVDFHAHPTQLKTIHAVWKTKNATFRVASDIVVVSGPYSRSLWQPSEYNRGAKFYRLTKGGSEGIADCRLQFAEVIECAERR